MRFAVAELDVVRPEEEWRGHPSSVSSPSRRRCECASRASRRSSRASGRPAASSGSWFPALIAVRSFEQVGERRWRELSTIVRRFIGNVVVVSSHQSVKCVSREAWSPGGPQESRNRAVELRKRESLVGRVVEVGVTGAVRRPSGTSHASAKRFMSAGAGLSAVVGRVTTGVADGDLRKRGRAALAAAVRPSPGGIGVVPVHVSSPASRQSAIERANAHVGDRVARGGTRKLYIASRRLDG